MQQEEGREIIALRDDDEDMPSQNLNGEGKTKRERYSNKKKYDALVLLETQFGGNASQASLHLGIPVSSLKDWRKIGKDAFKYAVEHNSRSTKETLNPRENKGKFVILEKELYSRFCERERWGGIRDDIWIVTEAKIIKEELQNDNELPQNELKFSKNWLRKFKKRWSIRRHRVRAQKMSLVMFMPIWKIFLESFRLFLLTAGVLISPLGFITSSQLFNFDETPLHIGLADWLKSMNSTKNGSGELSGVKFTVDITKRWASVVLTVRADGYADLVNGAKTKPIKPLLLFKGSGKRIAKKELAMYDKNVVVDWQTKGWYDSTINPTFTRMIKGSCSKELCGESNNNVFLCDNLAPHLDTSFVENLKANNCFIKALPPNTTHFSQPVDRHFGIFVKSEFNRKFRDWFLQLQADYRRTGQVQTVGIGELRVKSTQFVAEAWDVVLKERVHLMKRSFAGCGLSLPLSGVCDEKEMKFDGRLVEGFKCSVSSSFPTAIRL
jgi:hypothetical protein